MNDDRRADIVKILKSCLSGSVSYRIFETNMYFDRDDPLRPLWFKDRATEDPLENISACSKAQYKFNFKKGFRGKKKRTIIVIDI